MKKPRRIYQLKITLEGIRPPIWRRILVPEETTLPALHYIFQSVMGWHNSHLHAFRVGETSYSEIDPDFDMDYMEDEKKVKLCDVAWDVGAKFRYEYDFGDGWTHQVVVEKILEPDPKVQYPICIKGVRACPPEDCGGTWGYEELLEALADSEHEDHEDMLEWVGGSYNPSAFDLESVNARLRNS